jgi:hypothetical protein
VTHEFVHVARWDDAQPGGALRKGREIADELKVLGLVEQISPRHPARLLKKGNFSRTGSGIG